jgi:hypothetical protein
VRSLTSHNPIGLQGLLRDSFTLLYFTYKGIGFLKTHSEMAKDANNCLVQRSLGVGVGLLLFHRCEYGGSQNINYFSKPRTSLLASEPRGQAQQMEFCNWLNADRYILSHDGAQFTRYEVNSSGNSYLRSKKSPYGRMGNNFQYQFSVTMLWYASQSRDRSICPQGAVSQMTFSYCFCTR